MGPELRENVVKMCEVSFATSLASSPQDTVISLKRLHGDLDPNVADEQESSLNESKKGRQILQHSDCSSDDDQNLARALRQRPWISYHEFETSSEEDSDSEKVHLVDNSSSLPVGVVRGCSNCSSCQRVLARWRPEAGCRPSLDEAPVFFPLEEEFRDAIKYIASISAEAEQYGICRIVPPQSWRPPCPLRDFEKRQTAEFPTRVQEIHKLQVRKPHHKRCSQTKMRRRGRPSRRGSMGRRSLPFSEGHKKLKCHLSDENDKFGFNPGPDFTIEAFEKYACQFKEEYFGINQNLGLSSDTKGLTVEGIEGEYWRVVEHATEQVEVLYGADIETVEFGSGFPKAKPGEEFTPYETSGWNLNNVARQPGSVLAFEEGDISGVLVPWLYVGMCFSSFCWHVEDHHFYSLNYMHWGSPKVWYGVPSNAALKLEEAMKKHLPDLFEEQPDLLHKLVTQLSPSILQAEGVPVYRAVQKAGEFVVTFPRAYHAGFSCGFNCAEAVNVAPVDWLPHGQSAVELYRVQRRKSSVSHDKLLIGATKQALRLLQKLKEGREDKLTMSGWQELYDEKGILVKALKKRVDMEHARRAGLMNLVHVRRMDRAFDAANERECFICHYDLHLSAIGCECCPERYTCLDHVELLCACGPANKFALYRYDMSELSNIVAALEMQLVAVNNRLNEEKLSSFSSLRHENWEGRSSLNFHTHDSPCISTVRGPACRVKSDTLNFGLVYAGCNLNQQSYEFQLQTESLNTLSQPNVKGLTPLDFEENKVVVVEPGNRKVSVAQRPELVITECLLTSGKYSKPMESVSADCSSGSMLDKRISSDRPQMVEDKYFSAGEKSSPFLSNSKLADAKESLTKSDMELILLSDDEDDASAAKATGYNVHIDAKKEMVIESPVTRTQQRVHMKYQVPNSQCEGQGRNPKVEDGQGRSSPSCSIDQDAKLMGSTERTNNLSDDLTKVLDSTERTNNLFDELNVRSSTQAVESSSLTGNHLDAQQIGIELVVGCLENCHAYESQVKEHDVCVGLLDQDLKQIGMGSLNNCSSKFLSPKIGYQVELLDAGRLVLRKGWSNEYAIFPTGFKSRVLFSSTLDPLQTCFYVSEILDGGQDGPLFKVTMESCASEVTAVHPSIDRCWQMVQEQVNAAICRQCDLGKTNLPSLRAPEDIEGIELFGFTTPHIMKVVESLDWQHQCIEYWTGRLSAVELLESQHQLQASHVSGEECAERSNTTRDFCETLICNACKGDAQVVGVNRSEDQLKDFMDRELASGLPYSSQKLHDTLKGLFKKATPNELWMLYRLFSSEWGGLDWKEGFNALRDELAGAIRL